MLLKSAIDHFGNCARIAHALEGMCEPSAVYQWQDKGVVPKWAARRLVEITDGALSIDESLYDAKERIAKPIRRRKAS
jgi:hypothetical protein